MNIETPTETIRVRDDATERLETVRIALSIAPYCDALAYFIAAQLVGDGVNDANIRFDDGSRIVGNEGYTDIYTPGGTVCNIE